MKRAKSYQVAAPAFHLQVRGDDLFDITAIFKFFDKAVRNDKNRPLPINILYIAPLPKYLSIMRIRNARVIAVILDCRLLP